MTNNDLEHIEIELNITLPINYRKEMINYRYTEYSGTNDWSLFDIAKSIIDMTKLYRSGYGPNPPWPNDLLFIGDDDDACPYGLNLKTNTVMKFDHGNISREPLEEYDTFNRFIQELDDCMTE